MKEENSVVLEMRQTIADAIADARIEFLKGVKEALVDIDEKARQYSAAIGEINVDQLRTVLANYARERLS